MTSGAATTGAATVETQAAREALFEALQLASVARLRAARVAKAVAK